MCRCIVAISQWPVGDVGDAKLIAQLSIELVVLSSATQLDAHVGTLELVIAEGVDLAGAAGLPLATEEAIAEGGANEGQKGDVVVEWYAILNQDGQLQIVQADAVFVLAGSVACVVKSTLKEYGCCVAGPRYLRSLVQPLYPDRVRRR